MTDQPGASWTEDDDAPVVVVRKHTTAASAPTTVVAPTIVSPPLGAVTSPPLGADSMPPTLAPLAESVLDEATVAVPAQHGPITPKIPVDLSERVGDSAPELERVDPFDDARRRRNFALRLLGSSLVVLLILAIAFQRRTIEDTLQQRVSNVLNLQGVQNGVRVEVKGRDVTLSGTVADESMRQKVVSLARGRQGVRTVKASGLVVGDVTQPPADSSVSATVGASTDASTDASIAATTTLPPTTVARLRPTVVEGVIAGSVLTVKATVSDANVKDLLLKRASDNLTADELVSDVVIDANDGRSSEDAHRRVGEFLEYLVKSGYDEVKLRYDEGVLILEAVVQSAPEVEQLRAQAVRLVGDQSKLQANITFAAPLPTTTTSVTTTTTIAATTTTLSPEALVEQQRLDAIVSGRTIPFGKESDKFDDEGRNLIDEIAATILSMPNKTLRIQVGGHTDAKGSEGGNQRLSQRRADAVKNRLVLKGVAASRIDAVGFGETKPIGDNNTEEGRAQNRRIEFTIIGPATTT